METLLWAFFLFSTFLSVTSAITTNLALKKPAYVQSSYIPTSNGVDGDFNTLGMADGEHKWFVVDLGRDYRVHYVELYTRKDCCGERTSYFKVGLLKEFDRSNFQKNELCGAYKGETLTNRTYHLDYKGATGNGQSYKLDCKQPFKKFRFVSLHVNLPQYPDMGFEEFEVYGDDRTDYSIQYAGCYEGNVNGLDSAVTSIDQCIYICSLRPSKYAAVKEGSKCFCENDLPKLVPSANCNIRCSDDDHICGGKDNLSVYNVSECVEGNKSVACIQHCTQALTNGVCLGACEAGWRGKNCHIRDCASDNGMCGEDICAAFSTGPVNLTECVCRKGFGKTHDHYDNCTDINECEQDVCSDKKLECQNSVGSYQCVPIKENEKVDKRAAVGGVIGFLLIMALIILVVYCVKRRRKAKYSSNLQRDTNNPANA